MTPAKVEACLIAIAQHTISSTLPGTKFRTRTGKLSTKGEASATGHCKGFNFKTKTNKS
jgi:hypothetical protein